MVTENVALEKGLRKVDEIIYSIEVIDLRQVLLSLESLVTDSVKKKSDMSTPGQKSWSACFVGFFPPFSHPPELL